MVYIRNELCSPFPSCCTTYASFEGDVEAAVTTLVRPNLKVLRSNGSVEAGPVEMFERMMQLANHGSHGSGPVTRLRQERINA